MTEADWKEWLNHPVTEEVYKLLAKRRVEIHHSWANEGYISEYENAKALGMVYVLNQILPRL